MEYYYSRASVLTRNPATVVLSEATGTPTTLTLTVPHEQLSATIGRRPGGAGKMA